MIKRIICALLCFVVSASLCSCKTIEDISSQYDTVTEYIYIRDEDNSEDTVPSQHESTADTPSAIESQPQEGETITEIKPAEIKNTTKRPLCYIYLTKEQQRMYAIIYAAVKRLHSGWFTLGECSENYLNNASIAYRSLMADRPELFWLSKNFVVSKDTLSNDVYMALDHENEEYGCEYLFTGKEVDEKSELLKTKVEEIISATENLSAFETEKYFHDWLCNNVVYDETADETIFTAYGALINGVAVCEGYSRAMQMLCNKADIPSVIIYGQSRNSGHMWNLVCLENLWYHTDVTWDDQNDFISYTFFNLTDNHISADHTVYPVDVTGKDKTVTEEGEYNIFSRECSAIQHNYFVYNDLTLLPNAIDKPAIKMYEAALRGEHHIQFKRMNYTYEEPLDIYVEKLQFQLGFIEGCNVAINEYSVENDVLTLFF